jgi:hypothetical protein
MQQTLGIKINLILSTTIVFLSGFFATNSTPIGDDYCFALAASDEKIISNTLYYTNNWSPLPFGYLIQNTWWTISNNGHVASALITFSGFLILVSSLYILNRKIGDEHLPRNTILFLGIFFSSMFISRTGIFLTYSHPEPGNYPIIYFIKEFMTSPPDGRLSYWYLNAPLLTVRTILIAFIIYLCFIFVRENSKIQILLPLSALVISLISITESLYLGLSLVIYILGSLLQKKTNTIYVYISTVILIFIPILMTLTEGSQIRRDSLTDIPIKLIIYKSILIFLYLFSTIYLFNALFMGTICAMLMKKHTKNMNFALINKLRNIFIILSLSSLVTSSFVSATTYSAEYHWTTLHLFCFLAQFFITLNLFKNKEVLNRGVNSLNVLVAFLLIFSITVVLENIQVSKSRVTSWMDRSSNSSTLNMNQRYPIPRLDLLGNELISDLDPNYKTIVPGFGVKNDAGYFCYSKLPVGW